MSVQKFTREFLKADEEKAYEEPCATRVEPSGLETWESRVCCGCSCLCDDVSYQIDAGRIVRSLNLCELGWKRVRDGFGAAAEADLGAREKLEDSLEKAAEILRAHGPVLFLGAEFLDEEAQEASLRLAGAVRGLWLPWSFEGVRRFHQIACKWGWATALLDDVRDHAECVIFWRVDPLVTHHRHLSRYSFFARGRFTERGHHDRNLAAVGQKGWRIERLCRQFLDIPPEQDGALAECLRRGVPPEGFEHRDLEGLRKACEQSVYSAVFVDPEAVESTTLEMLFVWSAETNRTERARRTVVLPLYRIGPNLEGFCQVSLETVGAPWGVDFRSGAARPARTCWGDLQRDAGSVFLFYPEGGGESGPLPAPLADKPRVVLDPFTSHRSAAQEVSIPVALAGLDAGGVFFRADGVPLRVSALPNLVHSGRLPAAAVLEALLARVL